LTQLSVCIFFIASTCFYLLTGYHQAKVHLCIRQKKGDTQIVKFINKCILA